MKKRPKLVQLRNTSVPAAVRENQAEGTVENNTFHAKLNTPIQDNRSVSLGAIAQKKVAQMMPPRQLGTDPALYNKLGSTVAARQGENSKLLNAVAAANIDKNEAKNEDVPLGFKGRENEWNKMSEGQKKAYLDAMNGKM